MTSLAGGEAYITPVLHPFGLRLSGRIDRDARHELARTLTWAARVHDGDIHLDMGRLAFIDAGGLRLIVGCADGLPAPRRVVLDPATPVTRKLLGLLGWQAEDGRLCSPPGGSALHAVPTASADGSTVEVDGAAAPEAMARRFRVIRKPGPGGTPPPA
ncbi:STAS domain-containing protein [Actinomadura sp. ATCC 31491]|uniref:STAS domain-containing protein n=1 Tax=Actinomadura luzonensis TaxID=2805427 RepID=A0ABT0FW25_9ACTN|nr:STAS domain-containing protein [Actinomadura luzonensis]MCK2216103.1 STAS domain-containing protein [Actinomadura luzonensis]